MFMFLASIGLFGQVLANSDVNRLFEDLLGNYNKLVRPVRNPSEAIQIRFKFKLLQLLDVKERDQVIVTNGWLIHVKFVFLRKSVAFKNWFDYRLQWNPIEYGNVTMLHVPGEVLFRAILVKEL